MAQTNLRALAVLVLLVGFGAFDALAAGFNLRLDREVRHKVGDEPRWADPTFDDSLWSRSSFWEIENQPEVRWVRTEAVLPDNLGEGDGPPTEPLAILVSLLASHELYWDGVLIGQGGVVGKTAEAEIPGPLWSVHAIPAELAGPGRHCIALKSSAFHVGFAATTSFYTLVVGELRSLETSVLRSAIVPLLCLGGLVLVGLYFLVLFLTHREQPSHLLIGGLSLTVAAQLVAETWRSFSPYSYDLHIVRLRLIVTLAWLAGGLLVAFLAVRFRVPRGGRITALSLGLSAATAFVARGYDGKTNLAFLVSLIFASALGAWALRRRLPGAGLAATGVAVCLATLAATRGMFLDLTLFYAVALLLLFLLFAHALQIRQQRRDHEAALVNSMRLELELLKKHLSPHFLMNTLNSLSELFEQQPDRAGEALEALAEELRGLQEIASETLIPMARELELCRAHLTLMGFRRERRFRLDAEGVEEHRRIPPAMFHTLLENALTHNRYPVGEEGEGDVCFRLRQNLLGERVQYLFDAPGGEGESSQNGGLGTGYPYLRARLAEAFGEEWSLTAEKLDDVWRTEIVLPRGA